MSDLQRLEGAKLIEAEVRRAYSALDKVVDTIYWEPELTGNIHGIGFHNLHVKSNEKIFSLLDISREAIEDYPGKVNNELLNMHIRALAAAKSGESY